MPYIPSEKTNPPAEDRKTLDKFVEQAAQNSASKITNNFSLITEYKLVFTNVAGAIRALRADGKIGDTEPEILAKAIFELGEKYGYEGAFLGELNYALTRFIQRVPGIKVENKEWEEKNELRYWLYAATVHALIYTSTYTLEENDGISGVFEDIKDEYKWKVNRAYEAAQIAKNGDCFDAPFYTRLVEVTNGDGTHIGYMDILLKRSDKTVNEDILKNKLILYS